MSSERRPKGQLSPGLLILAVVMMSNPLVNIFDYFPDFIGCFIMVSALGYYAQRTPYFDEAKNAFFKLGLLSLAKIPTFILMIRITSQNLRESDVRVLFPFVFAVVEIFLSINAISNLFSALSYLGQRSDAASLITPFKISGTKDMSPDGLRILCYVFAVCRGALNILPEFLLLTSTNVELNPKYFNATLLYPYAITAAFLTILIFGIIFTYIASKFIKTVCEEGKIQSAADGMIDDIRREEIKSRINVKKLQNFLTLMTVSTILLFDFSARKLDGINIVPDFLFGIAVIFIFAMASAFIKGTGKIIITSAVFTVTSLVRYILEILFLNKFTYEQLPISTVADAKYMTVILTSILEFLAFVLLLVFVGDAFIKFVKKRTGISKKSENYGSLDAEYHLGMKKKCIGWVAIGVVVEVVKLIITLTRGHVRGLWPISFVFCLVFVVYSYYLFGKIKEEIKNKYL